MAGTVLARSIVCLTISLAVEARAGEYPDPTILLDSHVYQSDSIVEGRLVAPMKPAEKDAAVRITSVYRGPVKVGETIRVVGIGDYRKPGTGPNSIKPQWAAYATPSVPLEPKDHLILFLSRATLSGGQKPFYDHTFALISSPYLGDEELGARLVLRSGLYEFSQTLPSISGFFGADRYPPFVANVSPWGLGMYFGSPVGEHVESFRKRLGESAARAADWHLHLDRPPVADDIPWLISLLKQRYLPIPPRDPYDLWLWEAGDLIADDAAKQMAKLGDLPAMVQAIGVNPEHLNNYSLAFATPRGRDYLLGRVSDHSLAIAHRKSLAYLVGCAGVVHGGPMNLSATTRPSPEKISPRNDAYLTRIAQVAANLSAAGDNDIANVLLTLIDNQAFGGRDGRRDPQIDLDLHDAATVLREFYAKNTASEIIRFRIENAIYAISDQEYAKLQSPCGAMLTLAQPGNANSGVSRGFAPRGSVSGVPANTIAAGYEYRRVREREPWTSAFLVLEPVVGGNSYVVPSGLAPQLNAARGTSSFGQETLPLPPNFKSGRYRLHYRLMNGSTIVSEGHGFEMTLPRPQSPSEALSALARSSSVFLSLPIPTYQPWPRSRKLGIAAAILTVPALLILRAFMQSWRQRRRARKGLCPRCAYDLRFSKDRCPECGTPVAEKISPRFVRKCIARITLTTSAILLIATSAAWVRSYHVADCWVLSTPERADSLYFSRGVVVLNLLTTPGPPGWIHDRGSPAAFPRSMAESGDLPSRDFLGIEYSSLSDMLIVPMRVLAGLALACGALMLLMLRTLRRPRPLSNL